MPFLRSMQSFACIAHYSVRSPLWGGTFSALRGCPGPKNERRMRNGTEYPTQKDR